MTTSKSAITLPEEQLARVHRARERLDVIVSGDPGNLHRLDPKASIIWI